MSFSELLIFPQAIKLTTLGAIISFNSKTSLIKARFPHKNVFMSLLLLLQDVQLQCLLKTILFHFHFCCLKFSTITLRYSIYHRQIMISALHSPNGITLIAKCLTGIGSNSYVYQYLAFRLSIQNRNQHHYDCDFHHYALLSLLKISHLLKRDNKIRFQDTG